MGSEPALQCLRKKLSKNLRTRGLLGTISVGFSKGREVLQLLNPHVRTERALERSFDQTHGVCTAREVLLDEFDVSADPALHSAYQPTPVQELAVILTAVGLDCRAFAFVDLGAGMGRALLLASEFPFRRIVGVEFSPKLCRAAQANLRSFRSARQQCREFELVCCDVLDYAIPREPSVFYLFNPFRRPLLERVMANVSRSLQESPRELLFIYNHPMFDLREIAPYLEVIRSAEPRPGQHAFIVYKARTSNKAKAAP